MYVLHYSPDSASTIVRLVLEELGVPHECRKIDRQNGGLNDPAYRALSPLGLIPALETPDGPMFETAAILLYLADRHHSLAPAPDSPERAAFLSWLFFTSSNVHQTLLQFFYPERVAGAEGTDKLLTEARARMQTYLGLIDQMIERKKPDWLSPDQPSVLGYYLGVLVHWLASFDPSHPSYFRAADFPALNAVLAALETRPAAQSVAQGEDLKSTLFTDPY